ncbi:hypothetical protein ASPWEDRAFT_39665 [Aspergillus wentii DTO 134E9]|uniref:Ricin B lectin domain-containing protein n=1 Tax=Aspergillus wentii DTO 134E9 TaxID=1073089 RepID=A0A1L9RT19_ASPWE|nr:uncharacterized protein ASPWEDRAFT_39665 [Aspergillus wentii DTO 134E9]OJJ37957.1 hypothetical protein ASPWEDRAFT_39665 [Aspergillus wentii DTO 134E9]
MSDFTGPNEYIVVARHADKRLDLDDGKKEDKTKLQLFENKDNDQYGPNQRFVFADAGNEEYFIFNIRAGTYLTASSDGKSQITGNLLSPLEKSVRWKIVPVRDGSGSYYIYSVAHPENVIDIQAAGTENRTAAITYPKNGHKNQQFFLRYP